MTETQQLFFSRLNRLGTGERAALRREAGTMLREADSTAMAAFYRCLPSAVDAAQESKWYAVACLRCLWDAGEEIGKPFESVVAELIKKSELSASTRHRAEILLDTKWDSDGYMLAKLVRLVKLIRQKSDRTRIDFAALLDDMIRWNSESQITQRKWAREIFADDTATDEKE